MVIRSRLLYGVLRFILTKVLGRVEVWAPTSVRGWIPVARKGTIVVYPPSSVSPREVVVYVYPGEQVDFIKLDPTGHSVIRGVYRYVGNKTYWLWQLKAYSEDIRR